MGERQGLVHIRQLWKHVLQVTTAIIRASSYLWLSLHNVGRWNA